MLQVPYSNALSLPPSQTPTLVGRTSLSPSMAAEEASQSASDVRLIQETAISAGSEQPKVSLTFLLLSGKRKAWEFEQTDSFAGVKDRIFNEWPSGVHVLLCGFAVLPILHVSAFRRFHQWTCIRC